jgi:CBS domain containing-hemolysin-like protein
VAHSRYPVYEEDLDDVLGFLHIKDLAFMNPEEQKDFDITKLFLSRQSIHFRSMVITEHQFL